MSRVEAPVGASSRCLALGAWLAGTAPQAGWTAPSSGRHLSLMASERPTSKRSRSSGPGLLESLGTPPSPLHPDHGPVTKKRFSGALLLPCKTPHPAGTQGPLEAVLI